MSVVIYDRFRRPVGEQLEFFDSSLTEQHHKSDCDVNEILRRYMKTGILDSRNTSTPVYGDFVGTPQDYRAAVELLQGARDRFATLPSEVRERFSNDPLNLLQFLDDPANADEAQKLGLISRREKSEVAPEVPQNENNREAVTTGGGKEA